MVSNLFELSQKEINVESNKTTLFDQGAGAIATFEGRVRNHNEGKAVKNLSYEAYESLAINIANTIIQEAKSQFGILEARAIHRVGLLEIGEIAVWVGVSSAHRKEAFEACQYIIDEIKHRLPVWKKELYQDGTFEWVNCQACSAAHSHHRKEELEVAKGGSAR